MTVGTNTLYFTYDASGTPISVVYNGTTYFYATNLQGDVVAILDASGTAVVEYTYDAWGGHGSTSGTMSSTLGKHNPLRYRGYVYDQETDLYYLQSRYYNPRIGRFINADAYVSTGQGFTGNNMFAYCGNNPVSLKDNTGYSATLAGGIIGGFWGLVSAFTDEEDEDDEETTLEDVVSCVLLGMATGATAGFCADVAVAAYGVGTIAFVISAVSGGIMGAVNSAGSQYILDECIEPQKVIYDAGLCALMGGACTMMGTSNSAPLNSISKAILSSSITINTEIYMYTTYGYIGPQLAFDIGATAVTSFGSWLFGLLDE